MADDNFRVKNTLIVNGAFVANSTVVNASAIVATSVNATSVNATSHLAGANVTINTTAVFVGNSTVNTNIGNGTISISGTIVNSSIYQGTAFNANNLGGSSLTTIQNQITGNAATAYTNSVSLAATAYTNAITVASNATNLTSGTMPMARLGANAVNTSGAFTITGVHTHSTNIVMGESSVTFTSGSINSTAFSTGSNTATIGTAAYFVSNGNFGINTASPTNKLDVNGAANVGSFTATSMTSTTNTVTVGTATYFVSNGNVGIGSASPQVKLEVNGATTVGGALSASSLTTTTNTATIGTATYFVSNGNVGVGTSLPTNLLQLYNSTSSALSVTGDSTTTIITSRASTDATSSTLNFRKYRGTQASPTTVASSDQVGSSNYSAYDGTALRTVSQIVGSVGTYTTTDNVSGFLSFFTRPTGAAAVLTERIRIDPNGNTGIGNTAPTAKLHVQGTILASDNITAFSDARLKENIETIDNALILVNNIRGVRYNNKETGSRGIGVVAQEVQSVVPEVVQQNGEYLSVAYGNMVGLMIEAIKELSSEVNILKAEINQLKGD